MSLPKLNPVEPPWYGPVCPVVGEGWHRQVSPYPDQSAGAPPKQESGVARFVEIGFLPPAAEIAGPRKGRPAVDGGRSGKRKKLAWDADYELQQDLARPIIYHLRVATCSQPEVKGLTMRINNQYNGWRFEDVWLDK